MGIIKHTKIRKVYDLERHREWVLAKGYLVPCWKCSKLKRMSRLRPMNIEGHRRWLCLFCRRDIIRLRRDKDGLPSKM